MLRGMKQSIFIISLTLILSACTAQKETYLPAVITVEKKIPQTKDEIIEFLNNKNKSIKSFEAAGTLLLTEPGVETLECKVSVKYSKPGKIIINGFKPLIPSVFRLTLNDGQFHLYVPSEKIIITGSTKTLKDNPEYNISIDPELISNTLMSAFINNKENCSMTSAEFGQKKLSLYTENDILDRNIFFSVKIGEAIKEFYYTDKGYIHCIIHRGNFRSSRNESIITEHSIIAEKPITQTRMEFRFDKVFINRQILPETFRFEYPNGVDVERI